MPEFAIRPAHEILWSISYLQMRDTIVIRQGQRERDHNLATRAAKIREETATQNLVIRLALAAEADPRFTCGAIFHSRNLEKSSGADLELSIRRGSQWLNLVLQAKLLHPPKSKTGPWSYIGWDSKQNSDLIQWCRNESQRQKVEFTPGMLLYNHPVDEIEKATHLDPFGQCYLAHSYVSPKTWASMTHTSMFGWSPYWHSPVYWGTPAGISLCLDQNLMTAGKVPTLKDLTAVHFPIEHLAHLDRCCLGSEDSAIGRWTRGIGAENGPDWAMQLLDGAPASQVETRVEYAPEFQPAASVVIDLDPRF